MPRGVRRTPKSIDDQIAEIQLKIQNHQTKITELNAQQKALLSSEEKAEMDELYQFVKKTGKSPSEVLSMFAQ